MSSVVNSSPSPSPSPMASPAFDHHARMQQLEGGLFDPNLPLNHRFGCLNELLVHGWENYNQVPLTFWGDYIQFCWKDPLLQHHLLQIPSSIWNDLAIATALSPNRNQDELCLTLEALHLVFGDLPYAVFEPAARTMLKSYFPFDNFPRIQLFNKYLERFSACPSVQMLEIVLSNRGVDEIIPDVNFWGTIYEKLDRRVLYRLTKELDSKQLLNFFLVFPRHSTQLERFKDLTKQFQCASSNIISNLPGLQTQIGEILNSNSSRVEKADLLENLAKNILERNNHADRSFTDLYSALKCDPMYSTLIKLYDIKCGREPMYQYSKQEKEALTTFFRAMTTHQRMSFNRLAMPSHASRKDFLSSVLSDYKDVVELFVNAVNFLGIEQDIEAKEDSSLFALINQDPLDFFK